MTNNVDSQNRGFTMRHRDELSYTFGVIKDIDILISCNDIRDVLKSEVEMT